ncbi:hypothetical protein C8R47DRAFT_1294184 [Mycena vitilis]|nr:hypothetical protein C8R47DRAFT_1294184 [Mycena vitilis]
MAALRLGLPTVAVITVYGYGFTVTVAVPFYGYGSGRVRHRKHRKITAVYGALWTVQRSNGDLKLCPSLTDKSMEDHGRSKMILRQNEYQRSEISPPRLRKPKYLNLNMAEMPEYDAKLSKSFGAQGRVKLLEDASIAGRRLSDAVTNRLSNEVTSDSLSGETSLSRFQRRLQPFQLRTLAIQVRTFPAPGGFYESETILQIGNSIGLASACWRWMSRSVANSSERSRSAHLPPLPSFKSAAFLLGESESDVGTTFLGAGCGNGILCVRQNRIEKAMPYPEIQPRTRGAAVPVRNLRLGWDFFGGRGGPAGMIFKGQHGRSRLKTERALNQTVKKIWTTGDEHKFRTVVLRGGAKTIYRRQSKEVNVQRRQRNALSGSSGGEGKFAIGCCKTVLIISIIREGRLLKRDLAREDTLTDEGWISLAVALDDGL